MSSHPFQALAKEPTADFRGTPTLQCPCGCDLMLIAAVFCEDERLPAMYALDAMCFNCGALLTAPCPVDERLEID